MRQGKGYLSFIDLKKLFKLPQDALLKHMTVNNDTEEFEFSFYTNEENFNGNINSIPERQCIDFITHSDRPDELIVE